MDDLYVEVERFRGGCIRDYFHRWAEITSDYEVLETVSGLPIKLEDKLPNSNSFQYPFGADEHEFVVGEIDRLLKKNVIKVCDHEKGEFISPVFIRPKPDGDGFRMILNLKKLNEVSAYEHFKMDTFKGVLDLIYPGVFMVKLDIKDAYYSVPIKKSDQKLLKFLFDDVLYKYCALPNGYTKGPRRFTKLLKPILAILRKEGITLIAHLDDIIVVGWTYSDCQTSVLKVLEMLQHFGFVINAKKSILIPSTEMVFLGFVTNSISMQVTLPEEKKLALKLRCEDILHKNDQEGNARNTIRHIAQVLGKIVSSFLGVQAGRMHYRSLEKAKVFGLALNKGNYDKHIVLHKYALEDISWWKDNVLDSFCPIIRGNPELVITTDACLYGWGAALNGIRTGGLFSAEEKNNSHINVLEAKAVKFGLQALCDQTTNKHIKILSDNTSAVGAINKMGSAKSWGLDTEMSEIWHWALAGGNWLTASHIPGKLNVEADEESRKHEFRTEWMLKKDIFAHTIMGMGFSPNIDLFASRLNNQLPRFASFRPDPNAEIINAFTIPWDNMDFYAFPPFVCIAKVIQKIVLDEGTGILVVPDWPNQTWYNVYRRIVIYEILLPPRSDLLILPSNPLLLHPLHQSLSLRVGLVTGRDLCQKRLQKK